MKGQYYTERLHRLTVQCTRCHHTWKIECSHSRGKDSRYLRIKDNSKIDCLLGCSHPSILSIVFRIVILPFYFRRIIGYGEIIDDELLMDSRYVQPPEKELLAMAAAIKNRKSK